MSNKSIADAIKSNSFDLGAGLADCAEPKSIAELQNYGLNVRACVKGPDSIKFGINRVKQYPIKVTKSSLNFIDEIESYKWIVKDGVITDKPKDANNHLMDALRYVSEEILDERAPIKMVPRKPSDVGLTRFGV